MPTIIKELSINKIVKVSLLIVGVTVGMYVGVILVKAIFNLGVGLGTFLRCLYHVICY